MASKKTVTTWFEAETKYDRMAYEALTEVSWKLFREQFVRTRTYPFLAALSLVIAVSIGTTWGRYSAPVTAAQIAIFFFFLLSMPLSTASGKRRLCRKAIKEVSREGSFPFTVRFSFQEHGIVAELPADRVAETPYRKITDIIAYGKWLFLFVGDRSYILRGDSFRDDAEYGRFEQFIAARTGQTIWEMEVPRSRRKLAGL